MFTSGSSFFWVHFQSFNLSRPDSATVSAPLPLLIVGIISILAMFAFLKLGTRLFNFFDPSTLVRDTSVQKLCVDSTACRPTGNFSRRHLSKPLSKTCCRKSGNASKHHSTRQQRRISELNSQTILMLFLGTLGLQQSYTRRKALIPGNSYWFGRISQFQDWLRTSHSQLEIALRTGTAPRPDLLPNYLWFEEKLDEILGLCSNTLITRTPPIDWTALLKLVHPISSRTWR